MTSIKPLILLLCMLLCYSCKNEPKLNTDESTTAPIVFNPNFEKKTITQKIGDCEKNEACLDISIQYPLLTGVKADVQDTINKYILNEVIESMQIGDSTGLSTIEQATQLWVDMYKEYLSEDIDEQVKLSYDLEGSGYIYKHYAVTELPVYTFTGGAHPNHYTSLSNYNLNTGKLIEMEDIIADSTAFRAIVAKAFYDFIGSLNEDASDKDTYFWGKAFYLPSNFAIKEKGLYFLYNPYEIAAYALGSQEFTVPFSELGATIKLP
jgi:Protein of unknown function (DUF3298)/Deacetylase PdaC